ncbi:uncharacterized protein LOC127874673 [Dreissena polymorpha]|uniref:Uncharacterized protein n=1 Tax=Dreissena polymorpha TaxID=45954 RepID=A0A9D4R2P3_DREPO|nr:uncharacterized protein LOC127874673 [Dreissena polymorpha]KAH3852734.1 hypothetical protein DPMN_095251 [Dreissena polymorpha]
MKSLAKRVKNFFKKENCGHTLNSSLDLQDPSDTMSSSGGRENRPIPSLPTPKWLHPRPSRLSHRHAACWLRKHKATLDSLLNVLETYPSLLYQETCWNLRRFVESRQLVCRGYQAAKSPNRRMGAQTDTTLPKIFVSHADNDVIDKNKTSTRLPIRICGDVDNDKWHRLIVNLSCKFSIICHPAGDINGACANEIDELKMGVFVFLLDSKSFASEECRKMLSKAIAANMSIVFVRDMEFEINESENESDVFKYTEHENDLKETFTEEKTFPLVQSARSSRLRTSNLLSPVMVFSAEQQRRNVSTLPYVSPSGSRSQSYPGTPAPASNWVASDPENIDIDQVLCEEYGLALTYHQMYHGACMNRIISVIESKFHMGRESRASVHSQFSAYASSDSAFSESFQSPVISHDVERTGRARPESVSSMDSCASDTVYLVAHANGEPVVMRVKDADSATALPDSPSIDSFGFQDVDLSKRINELDFYDESEF